MVSCRGVLCVGVPPVFTVSTLVLVGVVALGLNTLQEPVLEALCD